MGRKHQHYKLLLDENFLPRGRLPLLNKRYDIKHIKNDFKKIGLTDLQVYGFAVKDQRIIITFNDKDFFSIASKSNKSGVIGVSTNMTSDHIGKKIAAFLRKSTRKDVYGKFVYISNETEI